MKVIPKSCTNITTHKLIGLKILSVVAP